jgi:glycolate dehydrogenase FAD-binding subunit
MDAILKPGGEMELGEAIEMAVAAGTPLELIGAGTKRGLGRPMQTARTLDLSRFSGISLYEPEELVITAGAATPLAEIKAALAAKDQMLAFEPPDLSRLLGGAHTGTIGGMLACNLSGPRRIKAGAARDHILGFAGVSGRGEVFKAGGRVVKNVTGYDLAKLMAGSFGTLAALTSLTFKVVPRPQSEETLCFLGLDEMAAVRIMCLAMQSPSEVSGAAHIPAALAPSLGFDQPATLLRLEGVPPSIKARRKRLASIADGTAPLTILEAHKSKDTWRAVRDVRPLCDSMDRAVWKISVPPMEGASTLERIRRSADARGYYDWSGGLIWADVPMAGNGCEKAVRSAFRAGHATLVRAPDGIRAHAEVFQPQERGLAALSSRVKAAFDPKGILNPGRMYQGM